MPTMPRQPRSALPDFQTGPLFQWAVYARLRQRESCSRFRGPVRSCFLCSVIGFGLQHQQIIRFHCDGTAYRSTVNEVPVDARKGQNTRSVFGFNGNQTGAPAAPLGQVNIFAGRSERRKPGQAADCRGIRYAAEQDDLPCADFPLGYDRSKAVKFIPR